MFVRDATRITTLKVLAVVTALEFILNVLFDCRS